MKMIEVYLCDRCEKMIMPTPNDKSPPNGFVVEGNIYVAEKRLGGLIGCNFQKADKDGVINIKEIGKNCFCRDCFLKVLHIETIGIRS